MNVRKLSTVLTAAVAIGLSACASQQPTAEPTSSADTMKLEETQRKLSMLESELRDKERKIASLETQVEDSSMKSASATPASSSLFPPNPRPGECYARVIVPAKYRTTTERVLKREASERIEIIPAKYGPGEERVLVKEASTRLEVIPAVYGPETQRVMVEPASKKLIEVPAVYRTETERVLDKAAHTVWKKGTGMGKGEGSSASSSSAAAVVERFKGQTVLDTRVEDTGELMCLVEVPASYKTITRQVLVSPPTTKVVEIPAKYETVTRTVMKEPPRTREVTIPAEYKTIKTTVLKSPAREVRTPIPAEYETVTKNEKISDEEIVWRPVLCEVNMTRANVSKLQTALQGTGCYKGPIDGIIGKGTLDATRCYADPKGLPYGKNYVTIDVIRSLGLKF